jgi:hypothetical protein
MVYYYAGVRYQSLLKELRLPICEITYQSNKFVCQSHLELGLLRETGRRHAIVSGNTSSSATPLPFDYHPRISMACESLGAPFVGFNSCGPYFSFRDFLYWVKLVDCLISPVLGFDDGP